MKICFGCDHGGFLLKEEVKKHFASTDIEIVDFGCLDNNRVDYPTFGIKVARSVANGEWALKYSSDYITLKDNNNSAVAEAIYYVLEKDSTIKQL